MLERYLAELRREFASRLSEGEVRARLFEAETHLRERVDALVELGIGVVEAEAQAVREFGAVRRLAKGHVPPPRRRRYVAGLLLGFVLFGCIERLHVLPWRVISPLELGFLTILSCAYFRAVFVARRPSGLTMIPVAFFAVAALSLYAYGLSRRDGFGSACRVLLYENPRDCGGLLQVVAEDLYECRFLIQAFFAWVCGIDLLAGGLGALVFSLRRRARGRPLDA